MYEELYAFQMNPSEEELRKTIVIVDDDIEDLFLMKEALFESNIDSNIICLQNGAELLDFLYHRGKFSSLYYPMPYLVFLDFHMPGMSGIQVLSEIRKDRCFDPMKVVIMSHNHLSQLAEEVDPAFTSTYFTKPFHLKGYHLLINNLKHTNVIEV